MNRNSKPVTKPHDQNDARSMFDKDQPSGPAGGPNPNRYKKELPPTFADDERSGLVKGGRSQENEPRDTPPDTERPPDQNGTNAPEDRQAPPFTGEDVERRRSDDSQSPSPSPGKSRIH